MPRIINEDQLGRFSDEYRKQLDIAVVKFPDEYKWPVENVPAVADRMIAAVRRGSFNKDGRAFKATCKVLGIKHTYTAISDFIAGVVGVDHD